MTHKITMKVDQPDAAGADFAALADQIIQDSWHLPPGGDQSWREQDAARIFSRHGKAGINDKDAPVMMAGEETAPKEDWPREPALKASRVVGILLPVSLATIIMIGAVAFSMPQLLNAPLGNAAKAAPEARLTQANVILPAPVIVASHPSEAGKLRPSLTEGDSAAQPARTTELRQSQPVMSEPRKQSRPNITSVVRLATAGPLREPVPRAKHVAPRLPPIGAAYFASHAPAVPVRRAAAADWKAEAAKWDERAAMIQARRERYQSKENSAGAAPGAESSRDFP